MTYSFLVLCAFCEAFLLRFFVALVEDGRNASRELARELCRSRQEIESEEYFPMNSQSRNAKPRGKHRAGTKSAAMVVIGVLLVTGLVTLEVRAQEASTTAPAAGNSSTNVPPDVAKQIEALTKRVEQLEQQLKQHEAAEQPDTVVHSAKANAPVLALVAPAITQPAIAQYGSGTAGPAKIEKIAPFSDWDWTWLNGSPRNK